MTFNSQPGACIRVQATMAIDEAKRMNDTARVQVCFVGHRGEAFAPAWGSVIAVFHDCPEAGAEKPGLVTVVVEVPTESLAPRSLVPFNSSDASLGGSVMTVLESQIVLGHLMEPHPDGILPWRRPRRS